MLHILKRYELASGQKLHIAKTSIFFSKNTGRDFREPIGSSVGNTTTSGYEKYLGLPAVVGCSKNSTFAGTVGRVQTWLDGWKERLLSQEGKEILIKAVVQSIPTYIMLVFQLPKTLCKKLNSLISWFWWGKNNTTNKSAWQSWEFGEVQVRWWRGHLRFGGVQHCPPS